MFPLIPLIAAIITTIALDALWLGVLMKAYYAQHLGPLGLAQPFLLWAGVLVWVLIAAGIVLFVLPRAEGILEAAAYGALLGVILYGVYDLTNYAVLARWPLTMVGIDIAWGTFLCAAASAVAMLAKQRFV